MHRKCSRSTVKENMLSISMRHGYQSLTLEEEDGWRKMEIIACKKELWVKE